MKPTFYVFAASVALIPVALLPAAAAPATDRAQIQAAYDQQNKAAAAKNLKLFMKTYSSDYKAIDEHGQTSSRQDTETTTANLFLAVDHISSQTRITAFTIKAGKAYVTAQNHVLAVAHDPNTQTSVTLIDDQVDSDVWTKVKGVWLEEYERVISDRTSTQQGTPLDGKPGQSA